MCNPIRKFKIVLVHEVTGTDEDDAYENWYKEVFQDEKWKLEDVKVIELDVFDYDDQDPLPRSARGM